MSAPLQIRSSNFFAYTNTLAAIWRTSLWLPEQDAALAQDPNVWEKVQEDIVVKSGIQSRLHKIAGRPAKLEPGGGSAADEKLVDVIQEGCLDPIDNLPQSKLNLAKGVFLGRSYAYIDAERRPAQLGGPEAPVMDWWIPYHLEDVQRERVRFVPRTLPTAHGSDVIAPPFVEVSDLAIGTWTRQTPDMWANFVQYVYDDDERRLGMGRGALAAIYLASYVRTVLLKHGLQGVEKLSQGLAVAKIDLDREGSTAKSNEALKTAFLNVLQSQRDAASAVVIGKDEELEYVFPSGTGGELVLKLLEYNDSCLTRYLTGSLLPTGGGSDVGSNARAEVEQQESADILQYESNLLDDALTRSVIAQFMRHNRANLARIGLGGARRPRLMPHREVKQNPKERAEVAAIANKFMALKKDELYEQLGFSMPTPEDIAEGNVIDVAAPEPSPFGMPGPGGDEPQAPANPALDRARSMADDGLRRLGREKLEDVA